MTKPNVAAVWGNPIVAVGDTIIQTARGVAYVGLGSSAPVDDTDGYKLVVGDSLVVPAGVTFYLRNDHTSAGIWYGDTGA